MQLSDVIGQSEVKAQIGRMLGEGRLPHALLFAGPEGCGKLPMALALAQRLLCKSPTPEGHACGTCSGCRMAANVAHPDLLFVFPVFKGKTDRTMPTSDKFMDEWRSQLQASPYFSQQEWLHSIGVENQQLTIGVTEAARIVGELSRTSSQNGYRVVVIWQAERMNEATANKLLKILEEPPQGTVFILTTSHPEKILATILSRTQRIDFPVIATPDMQQALQQRHGLEADDAMRVARSAAGNYVRARSQVVLDADRAQFFDMFVMFMRLCYARRLKDLNEWAQQVALWGREKQKAFLEYAQTLVRENFVNNFHLPELNYMSREEEAFSQKFSPFINERNVIGIMEELSLAQRDIEQNVSARIVFFDFSLKMIVLLLQ